MSSRRTTHVVAGILSLLACAAHVHADEDIFAMLPDPNALDMAPIDVLTFEAGSGAVSSFATDTHSVEVHQRFVTASASMLGIRLRALEAQFTARPQRESLAFGANLFAIDAWMIGESNVDEGLCAWWPQTICDPETGHWGFGLSVLGGAYDSNSGRWGVRVGELKWLWSLTPAYAKGWAHNRFMPFVGASLDRIIDAPGLRDRWLARALAGIDAAILVGDIRLEPSVRWRPSMAALIDDFGLEASVSVTLRRSQRAGLNQSGNALTIGVQTGYAYWSVPGYAFGADWSASDKSTLFVRLICAPSAFSAVPP